MAKAAVGAYCKILALGKILKAISQNQEDFIRGFFVIFIQVDQLNPEE